MYNKFVSFISIFIISILICTNLVTMCCNLFDTYIVTMWSRGCQKYSIVKDKLTFFYIFTWSWFLSTQHAILRILSKNRTQNSSLPIKKIELVTFKVILLLSYCGFRTYMWVYDYNRWNIDNTTVTFQGYCWSIN